MTVTLGLEGLDSNNLKYVGSFPGLPCFTRPAAALRFRFCTGSFETRPCGDDAAGFKLSLSLLTDLITGSFSKWGDPNIRGLSRHTCNLYKPCNCPSYPYE